MVNYARLARHFRQAQVRAAAAQAREAAALLLREHYTGLRVLQSAAGYYVGTLFWELEFGGYYVPGSRDSGYYATRAQAQAHCDYMLQLEDEPKGWGSYLPRRTASAMMLGHFDSAAYKAERERQVAAHKAELWLEAA